MGIYVKDMKMPKDCMSCPACQGDECWIIEDRPQVPDILNKRPRWCPLIEVSVHGRLVDADAMERLMSDTVQGDIRSYPYSDTLWDMAFRWLDNQPTIIPAEEDNDG